jgi:hypothetical protein
VDHRNPGRFLLNAPMLSSVAFRKSEFWREMEGLAMTNTLWKCEQFRAGQLTNKVVFDDEQQASQFVAHMRQMEPDVFWRMEPIDARLIWN